MIHPLPWATSILNKVVTQGARDARAGTPRTCPPCPPLFVRLTQAALQISSLKDIREASQTVFPLWTRSTSSLRPKPAETFLNMSKHHVHETEHTSQQSPQFATHNWCRKSPVSNRSNFTSDARLPVSSCVFIYSHRAV